MKVGKTRELLLEEITALVPVLIKEHKIMDEITEHLSQYNISLGDIMKFINDEKAMEIAPIEEVILFAEQIMVKFTDTGYKWIEEWLSPKEIKNLRTYKKVNPLNDKLKLPLELDNVIPLKSNKYMAIVPLSLIGEMYNSDLLHYNPELQREAKRKKQGDNLIEVMNLQMPNVNEITQQALDGDLFETTVYYNCQPFTGANDIELSYNKKTRKLTIHEGTIIDLLDGAHRTVGIYGAYAKNPELEGEIAVMFSNLTLEQAKRFQVDHAKSTPISKGRITELAGVRNADEVLKELKVNGELKGRITSSESVKYSLGEVVSYTTLSNAIDKYFKIKNRLGALKVAKAINEYMLYLFGEYPDELDNKDSLLFTNKMFVGHIYLASKMKEEGIPFSDLKNYLDKVDFSRSADIWKEYKVISANTIVSKAEKGIVEVFENIIWGS